MVTKEIQQKELELTMAILAQIQQEFQEHLKINNCIDFEEYIKYINNLDVNNERDYITLFENACIYYKYVATFPTKETIQLLKDTFSLKDEYLVWITDFKSIAKEIELINERQNFYAPYSLVFFTYYALYLPSKIRNILINAFKLESKYDGAIKNNIEIYVYRMTQNFKNRAKKGNVYSKNEIEQLYQEVINFIKNSGLETFTKTEANKIIKKEASGDVEKIYLIPIYKNSVTINQNADKEKTREFFDLFRTLLKETTWKTEDEFHSIITVDKNNNPVGLYDNNYNRYKEITMRNFLRIS